MISIDILNPICEIMIADKISIPEYCFVSMIIAWRACRWDMTCKNQVEKIMRIYIYIHAIRMFHSLYSSARILPISHCAFHVIDLTWFIFFFTVERSKIYNAITHTLTLPHLYICKKLYPRGAKLYWYLYMWNTDT